MKIKKDASFGVVAFSEEAGEWKVFLIHQYGSGGDIFWTFPKGHPESGESPEEAAKRELFEETGMTIAELKTETPLIQTYQFKHGEELIDKTVTYFVGVADTMEYVLQADEVKEAGWFKVTDAKARLTHESARAIFEEACAVMGITLA